MTHDDVKKLVSDRMREALSGRAYTETTSEDVRAAIRGLRPGDLKLDEDGVLEGMTFEVHEEPDDVKLIREVMEEPLDSIRATVTIRLPFDLKNFRLPEGPGMEIALEASRLNLLGPATGVGDSSADATAFETDTDPAFIDKGILRDELVSALAMCDEAERANPASVDGQGEAPVHK